MTYLAKKLGTLVLCVLFFSSSSMANEHKTKQVTFYIKEMTCQLCAYLVNKALRDVEGVLSTKATIKDKKVRVEAEESVSDEQLKQAIYKLHYTPEIVAVE